MKKRIISLLLSISMLATAGFTSCGKKSAKSATANDPHTIVIWHDKEDAVTDVLKKKLKTLKPDVKVVLEKKSDLTESLKMVGNDPNSAPDMYIFAHDKIGVYAEMGILEPITNLISKDDLSKFMDSTVEAATYKGNVYQMPLYYETLLFMYNRLYMKDEEVPKTTEELYAYMKENTGGGHYGFAEQHSTPYYATVWINGFGGEILSKDGKAQLNTKEVKEALTYHKKFVELQPGETEYATVNTLFSEGKAHSTIAGPWMIPTVKEKGMDVGIAPMPVIDETQKSLSPYMGVQGVQVLKNAVKTKKASIKKVLKVLMDPDVEIDLAKASGCAPAQNACYDQDEIKNDNVVMMMKQTADNAVPMPNAPEMDVMWTVLGNLMTDVNLSNKDIDESLKNAQTKADSLIKSMR